MTILFVAFIMVSTLQAAMGPAIALHKTGEMVTLLATKLPFISDDSVWGFQLNLIIQNGITVFGTVGNLAIELSSCIINNTILMCSELVVFNCENLSTAINQKKPNTLANLKLYREIIIEIQDLDRFILEMHELYYWRLFAAPILITYSVSMSIFCQYAVSNVDFFLFFVLKMIFFSWIIPAAMVLPFCVIHN